MSDPNARQRIQFAYNADLDSAVGETFQYLLKNPHFPSRTGKHKGSDAMMAFWKPFAYQEQGELSATELKAIAQESIIALTQQIELICETFGLEQSQATTVTPDLKQEIRQAVSEAMQQLLATGATMPTAQTTTTVSSSDIDDAEGVDFDEDALFGDLLDEAAIAA
ncbi:MAG: hypothetical protein AAF215_18820 [Cyanobacteria bacterium P01_A01_bin.123]